VFVRSFDVGVTAVSLAVSIFALSRLLFAPLAGRFVGKARGSLGAREPGRALTLAR
jgi:hypothetical protein